MSKDLEKEYLEDLDHYDEGMVFIAHLTKNAKKDLRLAKIDNANHSEALEYLEKIVDKGRINNGSCCHWRECLNKNKCILHNNDLMCTDYTRANTIKQALLEAQEYELKLDFLEDAMDLPTNCFSIFKNRNGDEVTVMRRERYEKYQEQEKVLEIINEYQVDIWLLKQCDYENYIRIRKEAMVSTGEIVNENGIILEDEITQEEFDLLKRCLGNV